MCLSRVLIVGSVLAPILPSSAEVLHPGSAFRRMPFNTPGTVEIGCGYMGQATPVDVDGDGDWDLCFRGYGAGGGAMFYENPGDAATTGVFMKGVRGKDVCAGWRFAMRADGGYVLTEPDRISRSQADGTPGPAVPLGVGTNNVHWGATDGTWSFRREGELTDQKLAAHSTCPAACDFDGDGVTDLVLGVEDGYIYHLANRPLKR